MVSFDINFHITSNGQSVKVTCEALAIVLLLHANAVYVIEVDYGKLTGHPYF